MLMCNSSGGVGHLVSKKGNSTLLVEGTINPSICIRIAKKDLRNLIFPIIEIPRKCEIEKKKRYNCVDWKRHESFIRGDIRNWLKYI